MSSGGISYPLWNMDLGKEKGKCNSPVKKTRFCGFYGMSCVHPLQVQGMGLPDSKERHMRIPRARWKALLEVARYAAELRPPVFVFFFPISPVTQFPSIKRLAVKRGASAWQEFYALGRLSLF